MRAVERMKLTASDVIVSDRLEPIVLAAVSKATSHRDNVRVRHVQELGYASDVPVVVQRTFLTTADVQRSPSSFTQSTTAVRQERNPRCINNLQEASYKQAL